MISQKKLFTPVRSINADETKTLIAGQAEGAYTLLDVRQPGEYEAGHIPGAKLIPLPDLKDGHSQLGLLKPVIVYCRSGARSMAAAQLLSARRGRRVLLIGRGVNQNGVDVAVPAVGQGLSRAGDDEVDP